MIDDATLELLLDLKHDLGKYLMLPLALLPRDAGDAALRDALGRALLQTRTRRADPAAAGGDASRHVGAAELWQQAAGELARSSVPRDALAKLERAVERALSWQSVLQAGTALERSAIERDLGAVQATIAELIAEARRG